MGAGLLAGCSGADEKIRSDSLDERLEGIQELAERDDEEAVARLAEAVTHEDMATAMEAVAALQRMHHSSKVQVLRDVAEKEEREDLRQAAVRALLRHREDHSRQEALEVIRRVLQHDPDPQVRAEAAAAIGRTGTFEDVDLLCRVARDAESVIVESRCVAAVEKLVGLDFGYSSTAPESKRREAVQRVVNQAPGIARKLAQRAEWRELR
jgi:hypothetical protein